MKFILAVTTYNRLSYLKRLVESWYGTRCDEIEWHLIVADDGSKDGTLSYLEALSEKETAFTLIQNHRQGVHHQTNTIIKILEGFVFDMCFKCDDDITFLKRGWDEAYYKAARQSGFEHLCFYDQEWAPEKNLNPPITIGKLACHCEPKDIQGAFFTITPEIIRKVGYFDVGQFGFKGLGHVDYTFRCCRLGFNNAKAPFDIASSNAYLELSDKEAYKRSTPIRLDRKLNTPEELERKNALLTDTERQYIAYESGPLLRENEEHEKSESDRLSDTTFYPSDGIYSIAGTLLKRIYNYHLKRGWTGFPRVIKKTGKVLMKIGKDLYFIDR